MTSGEYAMVDVDFCSKQTTGLFRCPFHVTSTDIYSFVQIRKFNLWDRLPDALSLSPIGTPPAVMLLVIKRMCNKTQTLGLATKLRSSLIREMCRCLMPGG